jgi:butyrate kinase
MSKIVLAINPGSTSTKFAVFQGEDLLFSETVRHDDKEMMQYKMVADQLPFRLETLLISLENKIFNLSTLDAVVGRGGLLKPLQSGTYEVNERMIADAVTSRFGEHASNLGAIIAGEIANKLGIPAFIVDPVGVDELINESRLSGMADIERISQVHALNIKAVSRKIAQQLNTSYEDLNFVVAHIGGGISVVAHRKGRIIDVNNADNEGSFSPERTGTLPAKQLVRLCYSGEYNEQEMLTKITKVGGVYSYLGTKSMVEVEERVLNGDKKATLVLNAMIHQLCKEIGAMSTVLQGDIDGIILTGGICFSEFIVEKIKKKVSFLSNVYVVPGEEELEALAAGALRVLTNKEKARKY